MRRSNLQTSRLLLEPTPKNATLEIFISTPTLSEEYALGKLFGLIHIESTKDEAYEIAITIRRETERRYYQGFNLKNDISVEKKFEETLAQLNQTIAELIEENRIHIKLEQIHFILGVIHKRELHFTQFGNTKAYLIHKIKGKDYRPINILESTDGAKPQTSLIKLFSNIVSGEIGSNDALLFVTETVTDYLSLDKLVTTIIHNSASEANAHLATLLKEIDSKISFGALILKYPSLPMRVPERRKETKTSVVSTLPERSIADLAHTESKTEDILSPRPGKSLKKHAKVALDHIKNTIGKTKSKKRKKRLSDRARAQTNIYQRLAQKKTRFKSPSGIVLRMTKKTLSVFTDIYRITISLFQAIFIKKEKHSSRQTNRIPRKPQHTKRISLNLGQIPKKIKIIFGAVILLIAVLVISSISTQNRENQKHINEQFDKQIKTIQAQIDQADAALIYGDDERARNMLIAAESLIKKVKTLSEEQEKKKSKEESRIEKVLNKMRRIENVAQPKVMAVFGQDIVPGQADTERFISFIKIDNSFVVLSDKEIYYYQIDKNKTTHFSLDDNLNFSNLILDDNSVFITSDQGQVFELDIPNKTLKEYSIGTDSTSLRIIDSTIYANRLYILDSQSKQILRMPQSGRSFGAAQFWIKDDTQDIEQANSFAIDGTIFVLFNDGTISQYSSGVVQENFSIPADPELKNPSRIFTNRDTDFLYILDPKTDRLVVLTKSGKLIKQYTSEAFNQLTDFAIDEANKKIYVLNKNVIYEIEASHLP